MIAGIDEAGRGALIGPLVVAIFLVDDLRKISKLGLRDSKQLSPKQRSALYHKLKEIGKFEVVKLKPSQIDARNINHLELDTITKLIEKHKPKKAYIDCFLKNS